MKLNDLQGQEKAHWELHLKATVNDLGMTSAIRSLLSSKDDLPELEHPSYIHDWLEYPEMREDLESWQMYL